MKGVNIMIFVFFFSLLTGCLTVPLFESSYANISVTYSVKNTSNDAQLTIIVYKDVLGDIEEDLYMEGLGTWEKTINFRLKEYGSEHLHVTAHSLYGTFETKITINDINKSVSAGSRIKSSGDEYYSLSQLHIDRDTIRLYK
jgi:hypothetical protein